MRVQRRLVAWTLSLSAAYGVASALTFNLLVGPFAGAEYIEEAVGSACLVALPYALLYLAYRLGTHQVAFRVFVGSAIIVVTVGGLMYSGGFGPNDGEYALVFIATPLMQLPLVILTLVVSMWKRRTNRGVA